MSAMLYEYRVVSVDKVIDGDTVELTIDLGFNLHKTERFRMRGYDAPESYRPLTEAERAGAVQVKSFFVQVLEKYAENLYVRTFKDTDIYGRYSADLFSGSFSLNEQIQSFIIEHRLTKEELRK